MDIASSIQKITENIMIKILLDHLRKEFDIPNLMFGWWCCS